jgi:hypothetical protein
MKDSEINNIRDIARDKLTVVPQGEGEIPSSNNGIQNNGEGDNKLFHDWTNVWHGHLWASWKSDKNNFRTCCNEFVGVYGRKLGFNHNLGRFPVKEYLFTIKKGHAWVASSSLPAIRPKYGDILLNWKRSHMEVALDFDGLYLLRAAAGQGGPQRDAKKNLIGGIDRIKRVWGNWPYPPLPYDSAKFQGWVDIELFHDPGTQEGSVPDWLLGWWVVTWSNQIYYYYFNSNFEVIWTQDPNLGPITDSPPQFYSDMASFGVVDSGTKSVAFRWCQTGTTEKYTILNGSGDMTMIGTAPNSSALRLVNNPTFGKWKP